MRGLFGAAAGRAAFLEAARLAGSFIFDRSGRAGSKRIAWRIDAPPGFDNSAPCGSVRRSRRGSSIDQALGD
jgi:hypothetical protein